MEQLSLILPKQTRNNSYAKSLDEINDHQRLVYHIIKVFQPIHDQEIAEKLGWKINSVTGRRSELVEYKLIKQAGNYFNKATNRTVCTWGTI